MDAVACPGCLAHQARIAELERRLAALEARLGTNSTNSSVPPSANPLDAPKPVTKRKSKRRHGGQPGHPPHLKRLLPADRVEKVITFRPDRCDHCRADLTATAAEAEPTRFQTVEVPPVVSVVTEYRGLACACPACGGVTRGVIPQAIRAHGVGPRLTAILSYFTGCHGVSKRGAEEITEAVFAAPIALGTVVEPRTGGQRRAGDAPRREALGGRADRRREARRRDELEAGGQAVLAVGGGHVGRRRLHDPRQDVVPSGLTALLGDGDPGDRVRGPLGALQLRCPRCAGRSAGRT